MRGSQATPVDPRQNKFARGWFDMPCQDVVVTHSNAGSDRLKNEILRPVRFYDFVTPDGTAGSHLYSEQLQAIDAFDHARLNADPCVTRIALGSIPVSPAAPFIYIQRVGTYIVPTQADQFADAEACPHGHKNHAGVRFRNQLQQFFELFWGNVRFGFALAAFFCRYPDSLDRVLDQQSIPNC